MEKLMQYLWQHKLQIKPRMSTVDGKTLQVIDPGRLNTDSGPDFFNAKIKIDGQLWVGNVEIHVRASDWFKHGHDKDRAYDSVILHVVGVSDRGIRMPDGRQLPQLLLPCNPDFASQYTHMVSSSASESIPCKKALGELDRLHVSDWLGTMGFERMQMKVDRILDLLDSLSGDWEEAAYITLARALGFNTNSEPFERLARSMPLRYLRKHADFPLIIEAMLLGQSGLLDTAPADNIYATRLINEYKFMAVKFELHRPDIQWKMSRMRPANLPHRRIALLAHLLTSRNSLLSNILAIETPEQASEFFNRPLDGYWRHAYTFNCIKGDEATTPIALSRTSVITLMINVVAPLMYAWGQVSGDHRHMDRAVSLLESLPAEHNKYTLIFEHAGIDIKNALESQALIQVKRSYCDAGKCLYCRVGHRMLSHAALYKPFHP
ncbi:MAG: DUF2851 family protein [Bacteroides sp.]|nr:DUF2851 family protein [Bacteroides sp.]